MSVPDNDQVYSSGSVFNFVAGHGGVMKTGLMILVFLVLLPYLLCAATDEEGMFDKARELTYEGQLQKARQLMEGEAEPESRVNKDESWDGTVMMLGMIWGALGTGYFIYGKKMAKAGFMLCGVGLVILPLFVSSVLYIALFGIGLSVIPFKVDL